MIQYDWIESNRIESNRINLFVYHAHTDISTGRFVVVPIITDYKGRCRSKQESNIRERDRDPSHGEYYFAIEQTMVWSLQQYQNFYKYE